MGRATTGGHCGMIDCERNFLRCGAGMNPVSKVATPPDGRIWVLWDGD